MATISKNDIKTAWLELMEDYSSSLENEENARGARLIKTADLGGEDNALTNMLSLPGVLYDRNPILHEGDARPVEYIQFPYSILNSQLNSMKEAEKDCREAIENTDTAIESVAAAVKEWYDDDHPEDGLKYQVTEVIRQWNDGDPQEGIDPLKDQIADAISNANEKAETAEQQGNAAEQKGNTAEQQGNTAETKGNTAKDNGDYAKDQGDYAKTQGDYAKTQGDRVDTAVTGAERVNAQLDGMTVTVTNRNGVSNSCNLSFDFYETYASVAAMNADLANIPKSSLVSIATDDPTNEENARVYQKRSDGTLKYLFDLDQASAQAWAEWLNTKKPQIDARIATADDDHSRAETDHETATTDHGTAQADHSTALSDHAQAESDTSRAATDHAQAESDTARAATDHQTATSDHNTAETDHGTATSDHETAEGDHTQAGQDHSRAEQDHITAEGDHMTAEGDHTQAGTDHSRAEQDHTTADNDHTQSETDHAASQSATSYAENVASHPPYIADGTQQKPGDVGYVYQWDYANQTYVKGIRVSLDWNSMSQDEKDAIEQAILTAIGFDQTPTAGSEHAVTSGGLYTVITALDNRLKVVEKVASTETCEDIVSELV